MKTMTMKEFHEIEKEAGEIVDHRCALINERLFDVTRYDETFVLTIYDATEVYNASHTFDYRYSKLLSATSTSDREVCHAAFLEAIAERLTSFDR